MNIPLHVTHLAFVWLSLCETTEKYFPDNKREFPENWTFSFPSSFERYISASSIADMRLALSLFMMLLFDSHRISLECVYTSDDLVSDFVFLGDGGSGSVNGTSQLSNPTLYGMI